MATAQVVTLTEKKSTSVKKVSWDWLSTDLGVVTQASVNTYDGVLERAVFIPDAAGTQPSDNYDITITDADGADVLATLGANLSNAATVTKVHSDGLGAVAGSVLTLNITNSGNAKGGIVHLYLR